MTRQIPLTRGQFALIDDEDFERVSARKWSVRVRKGKLTYPVNYTRTPEGMKAVDMHRFIMEPGEGLVVDHINGNGLDNRRVNLRICTQTQNAKNRRKHPDRYKGVRPCARQFETKIKHDDRLHYVGYFKNEITAAVAYDVAATILHGEFANLNFGTDRDWILVNVDHDAVADARRRLVIRSDRKAEGE